MVRAVSLLPLQLTVSRFGQVFRFSFLSRLFAQFSVFRSGDDGSFSVVMALLLQYTLCSFLFVLRSRVFR